MGRVEVKVYKNAKKKKKKKKMLKTRRRDKTSLVNE